MTILIGIAGVVVVLLVVTAMIVSTPRHTRLATRASAHNEDEGGPVVTPADSAR